MVQLFITHWLIVTQILGIWLGMLLVLWLFQKIKRNHATLQRGRARSAQRFDQELLEQLIQHESERAVAQIRAAQASASGDYSPPVRSAAVSSVPARSSAMSRRAIPETRPRRRAVSANPKKSIARHYADVARMLASGMSVKEIQARVKIPTCEIELMQKFNGHDAHWLTGGAVATPYAV